VWGTVALGRVVVEHWGDPPTLFFVTGSSLGIQHAM
jgi:hypothetical protein